eukprot:jgi/Orpsp1_1/1175679/evm.model.c7180000054793.1
MVKLLIEYANRHQIILELNDKNFYDDYPLSIAISNNNIEIIKLLTKYAIEHQIILEYEEKIIGNNSEIMQLLKDYENEKSIIMSQQDILNRQNFEREELELKNQNYEEIINNFKKQFAEIEANTRKNNDAKQNEINQLLGKINSLEKIVENEKTKSDRLEKQLKDNRTMTEVTINTKQNIIDELNREINEATTKISSLEKQLIENKVKIKELIDQEQNEIQPLQENISMLEKIIEDEKTKSSNLEKQLEDTKGKAREIDAVKQNIIDELNREINEAKGKIILLEKQLEENEAKISEWIGREEKEKTERKMMENELILACYFTDEERIENLIKKQKVNVNVKNKDGDTPLIIACYFNHKSIIELLVANGAKVNVENNYGESPISILKKFDNNEILIIKLQNKKKNECKTETLIDVNNILCNIQNFEKFANSVFKIKYYIDEANFRIGTGYFIKLPIPSENESLYGLMTCNHILDSDFLVQDFEFIIIFNNGKKEIKIKLDKSYFMFTSKLLDVTFIHFNDDVLNVLNLNKENFLIPCQNNYLSDEKYYIIQYPQGGDCKFSNGNILYAKSRNSFNYFHTIITIEGSSGSPLTNSNFEIIGLHKGKNDLYKNENEKIATKISVIIYAIHAPKKLSTDELNELKNHRLQRIQKIKIKNSNKASYSNKIFVTSDVDSSQELYFYRTNHAWYWTDEINEANENEKFRLKNLKKCKWRIIKSVNEEEEDEDDISYNEISHTNN